RRAVSERLERVPRKRRQPCGSLQRLSEARGLVGGGFRKRFVDAERGRIRARLAREGTSSKEFEQWFLKEKVPQLQAQARKQLSPKGPSPGLEDPLVRAAATRNPEQLLEQARQEPAILSHLRDEWIQDTLDQELATIKQSPAYQAEFGAYYMKQRETS